MQLSSYIFFLLGTIVLACKSPKSPEPVRNNLVNPAPDSDTTEGNITSQIIYESHIESHESDDADWYENIPVERRNFLLTSLLEEIKQGDLKAYRTVLGEPNQSPEFLMDWSEIETALKDTVEQNGQVKSVPYNPAMLSRLTFVESWDYQPGVGFTKKVKGLAVCREVYNEAKEYMGYKRLFWVWFEQDRLKLLQ